MSIRPVTQHSLLEQRGGAARVADLLCQGLGGHGFSCERTFELAESEEGRARLVRSPWPQQLVAQAAAGAVIHVHAARDWPGLLGLLARLGAPAVLTLHDCRLFTGGCPYPLDCPALSEGCADPCPRGFADSAALRRAIATALAALDPLLVAPSRWMKEQAARHLPGHAVRVVPNGVPWAASQTDLPTRAAARAAFGLPERAVVVLLAAHGAQAAHYKGGQSWQALWEALSAGMPDLVCVMAGGEALAREGSLVRLPYLPPERLTLLMRACDLMLYPTLADNHPLIVLEAMSQGLPTLAYAVGGLPEQIADDRTGFLAQPGDLAGFVERAAKLLAAPGLLRRVGEEAWRQGARRFSLARMAADHAALYERLGAGGSSSARGTGATGAA